MISTNDATVTLFRRQTLEAKNVRTLLRFTVTGIVIGLLIGWLLSLVSGKFSLSCLWDQSER
jgi:hypothetical protein